jgi:single-strand DNA-binding protein
MNTTTLTGRLVTEPELRPLPKGGSVCKLRLAVEGMGRGGRREVGYINVSAFGAGGQQAARRLHKGSLVGVQGRLQYGEWEDDAGERRHDYEVIGDVEFLDPAPHNQQHTDTDTDTGQTDTDDQDQETFAF